MSSQFNYNEGTTGDHFNYFRTIVQAGENIVDKLLEFSRRIRDSFIIFRSSGTISRAEIIRPGDRNEIHEGDFRIVSLNGSYTLPEENTGRRNWSLKVLCAEPNGHLFGGIVGSSLIAAGPTEVVLAVFSQRRPRQINVRTRRLEPGSTSGSQPPVPGSTSGPHPLGPGSTSGSQPPEPGSTSGPHPSGTGSAVASPPQEAGSAAALQPPEPRSASGEQPPEGGSAAAGQPPESGSASAPQELSTSDFETGDISFKF